MKTDTEIRLDGLKALTESLGQVEAERFVALLSREPFEVGNLALGFRRGHGRVDCGAAVDFDMERSLVRRRQHSRASSMEGQLLQGLSGGVSSAFVAVKQHLSSSLASGGFEGEHRRDSRFRRHQT